MSRRFLAQFETLAPQVVGGEVLAQERVAFQLGEQDHDRPLGARRLELDQTGRRAPAGTRSGR